MSNRKELYLILIMIAVICFIAAILYYQNIDREHHHKFQEKVVVPETCTENGKSERICSECGYKINKVVHLTGHSVSSDVKKDGKAHKCVCENCGVSVWLIDNKKTNVRIIYPDESRADQAVVTVKNSEGYIYQYPIYKQGAGYEKYSRYLKLHGCSTCAMTTLLNATSKEAELFTPDQVIEEIEPQVVPKTAMQSNYSDDENNGRMPLSLYSMTKIFNKCNVEYDLPVEDGKYVQQIENHLRDGNPVILTFAGGKKGGLSRSIHTILLLGMDSDNYVIIGDSVLKSKKIWGSNGLVKPGKLKVVDIVSYIQTYGDWSVSSKKYDSGGNYFYHSRADRGYILVKGKADRS